MCIRDRDTQKLWNGNDLDTKGFKTNENTDKSVFFDYEHKNHKQVLQPGLNECSKQTYNDATNSEFEFFH